MNHAIEVHVAEHVSKAEKSEKAAVAARVRQVLVGELLSKASEMDK